MQLCVGSIFLEFKLYEGYVNVGVVVRFIGGGGRGCGLGGVKGFFCFDGIFGGRFGLRLKIGLDLGDGCFIGFSDVGFVDILFFFMQLNFICFLGFGLGEGGGGLLRRGDFFGIFRGFILGGGQYIGFDVDCCEFFVFFELDNGYFLNKVVNCFILNFGFIFGQ